MIVRDLVEKLEQWMPPGMAESWDNVGLLLGRSDQKVERIMTCLTVTSESATEAVNQDVDLIITHHPVLFRPIKRLRSDGPDGFLCDLIRANIAVYSPHTAFDNAFEGINQLIASRLHLVGVQPMRVTDETSVGALGAGRWGKLDEPISLERLAGRAKTLFASQQTQIVGDPDRICGSIAIACGAAGEFLEDAHKLGCDAFVTGEVRFHDCLRARELGIGLILVGHYESERFAVEWLSTRLVAEFPRITAWPSKAEANPLITIE